MITDSLRSHADVDLGTHQLDLGMSKPATVGLTRPAQARGGHSANAIAYLRHEQRNTCRIRAFCGPVAECLAPPPAFSGPPAPPVLRPTGSASRTVSASLTGSCRGQNRPLTTVSVRVIPLARYRDRLTDESRASTKTLKGKIVAAEPSHSEWGIVQAPREECGEWAPESQAKRPTHAGLSHCGAAQ